MKKVFKYLLEGLTFILICLTLYIIIEVVVANVNNRPPRIFGISISYVPTNSMEPVITPGDYVIYTGTDFDAVKKDDIIVYFNSSENKYIIHRVIEKYDSYMIVKGDNNMIADSMHVTKDNLVGKYIGKAGILKIFAGGINQIVVYIILFILVILFITLQVASIILKVKKEKMIEDKEKIKDDLREEMKKELLEEIKNEINKQ